MKNDQFDDELDIRNKMERSSVNSSTGELHSMKKAFLEILQSDKYPSVIRKIVIIGIAGLLILTGIITGFFIAVR